MHGDKQRFNVVHKRQVGGNLFVELVYRVGVFFYLVPLVHNHHARFALLVHETRYLNVLLGKLFARVEHNEHYVGSFHCRERTQNAVTFHAVVVYTALAAHAGGVYKNVVLAVISKRRVYRVARSARNVAHYNALKAEQLIHYRGFTHVGFAHNGNTKSG